MLLPQRGSDFDFKEFIEGLLKFLVFGFLFILPVIKSILEARKQRAEQERKRSWSQPEDEPAADVESEGQRAFEALSRGEPVAPAPAAPAQPPPLVLRQEARQDSRPENYDRERSFDAQASEEPSVIEERSLEDQSLQPLAELATPASLAGNVEGQCLEEAAAPQGQLLAVGAQMETHDSAQKPAALRLFARSGDRRAALREAIVLREVLGPPLALRAGPGGLGSDR
jgi:hypothetical protein